MCSLELVQEVEKLMEKGAKEEALSLLEPLTGAVSSWLRGRIYANVAEEIVKSFAFQHYPTEGMKLHYRKILSEAYHHFFEAGMQLQNEAPEVQDMLNQYVWHHLSKVESELARTKPPEEDTEKEIYEENYVENYELMTANLADDLKDWNL